MIDEKPLAIEKKWWEKFLLSEKTWWEWGLKERLYLLIKLWTQMILDAVYWMFTTECYILKLKTMYHNHESYQLHMG